MEKNKLKQKRRLRRKFKIRKRLTGTAERPRLSVSRSLNHIYCQIIDDSQGRTLASASTRDKSLRDSLDQNSGNRKGAEVVGQAIAQKAKELGVSQLAFDRNGFRYHGRIAALADAVRKEGVKV